MVLLKKSDVLCFILRAMGTGDGGQGFPPPLPESERSVNPIPTEEIMSTTLLLSPRIFNPSYGPESIYLQIFSICATLDLIGTGFKWIVICKGVCMLAGASSEFLFVQVPQYIILGNVHKWCPFLGRGGGVKMTPKMNNLFVTSKTEFSTSRILKCCIKAKEPFKPPF